MSENHELPEVKIVKPPESVPVFNCRVFVRNDGGCRARVANLAGIEVTAASEREAIQGIVRQFKQLMAKYAAEKQSPPWLDPELTIEDGEQERLIPVHL